MQKPNKNNFWDYSEIMQYLEKKYNFTENDYYSYNAKLKILTDKALAQTKDKFQSISFWTKSPNAHTAEEKQQEQFYTACLNTLKQENPLPKELDFWNDYMLKRFEDQIFNGCIITLEESDRPKKITEFINIFDRLMNEFGEGEIGKRKIVINIWW